jgi:hypothetical protein
MAGRLSKLRQRFGIAAPKVSVRTHVPWYLRWLGLAVALVLSVAALAAGVTALFAARRTTSDITGRLVQSRATNEYGGPPLAFPLDDFFIGRGSDGVLHAFYAYPPGYFGHERGCKIVWFADAKVETSTGTAGPGLYVDPCGGARFDRDGQLVAGPADRNLDFFATEAAVEGTVVNTQRLYCGSTLLSAITPAAGEASPTPTATPEQPPTCERVSANTKRP